MFVAAVGVYVGGGEAPGKWSDAGALNQLMPGK